MKRDLGPRLVDLCPDYANALDAYGAEPTEERWQAVMNAAYAFRQKVRRLEREDA